MIYPFGYCQEVYKTETKKYLLGLEKHRLLVIIASAAGVELRDRSRVGVVKGMESMNVNNSFE